MGNTFNTFKDLNEKRIIHATGLQSSLDNTKHTTQTACFNKRNMKSHFDTKTV